MTIKNDYIMWNTKNQMFKNYLYFNKVYGRQ